MFTVALFSPMAPHRRKATQTKAKEDATREANIAATIQAVRKKRAENLLAAAGEVNVPFHTLRRHAQNITKPHSKAHKFHRKKHHVMANRTGAFLNYIHQHNQDHEAGGVARHSRSLAITRDRTQSRSAPADSAAL
ncbi:hypothetical protein BDR04DRAFT_1092419 [Suillus decipiens]|nr:hypothetical protein BDR04DRAFT_1092419 [Suillus decipiens]